MKLTKDESRILAWAINDLKFRLGEADHINNLFENLECLEIKLENFGKDNRRVGRTSQDDFTDLLKRFAKKTRQ